MLREDRFAFDRFTKLPPEIMRKIIDYVHYDDVINFRKAYKESGVPGMSGIFGRIANFKTKTRQENDRMSISKLHCEILE